MTIENNTISTVRWAAIGLRGKESTGGRILNNILCDAERAVVDGDCDFSSARPAIEHNLTFRTAPLGIAGEEHRRQGPALRRSGEAELPAAEGQPRHRRRGGTGRRSGPWNIPTCTIVDPRHPAAADEPGWGYPAVPLATLARACELAEPGETIVLRGGRLSRDAAAPARRRDGARHAGREGHDQRGGPDRGLET